VYRREELFHGPHVKVAPDLVAWFNEDPYNFGFDPSARSAGSSWISEYGLEWYHGEKAKGLTGNHRLDGILFMYGPGTRQGHKIKAEIVDVAPTILYLLGHPVPTYMDGRVLEEALGSDFLARHPVRIVDAATSGYGEPEVVHYTEGEEDMIEDRLRGLGYLG
jgi:predicted AlkP superfamily phosphohydrolase/phosphomutase